MPCPGLPTGSGMALGMRWAIGLCAAALAGLPAAAAEMKIGFVNTERVFREAAPAKRAQAKLEKEFTFDFSAINVGNSYSKIVLIFDLGTAGDGSPNFTYYFDDIKLN